jgi:hypothetical protein
MWNYFSKYKQLLQSRSGISDGSKDWYELVRPRDERWLSAPKLVMRDLALKTSFAIDPNGTVFLIGGTAIVPENPDLLLPLLAYLNSGLINWFLSPLTPGFRSEFQKYEPQHLSRLPVLKALLEDTELQNILSRLATAGLEARQAEDERTFQKISFEIDSRLSSIVGVDPKALF